MDTQKALRDHFDALVARKEAIQKKSAPLRAKREKLNLQVEELRGEVAEMTKEIRAIEEPEIITLSAEISRVAQALGGRRMSDVA